MMERTEYSYYERSYAHQCMDTELYCKITKNKKVYDV